MKKDIIKTKDVIVSGFALFAIFFGAGNLILPPFMGLQAGKSWILAWIGFSLSGPGLTALGMIAMAKNQGDAEKFAGKVGIKFSILLGSLVILFIGPLMSVPRTGATTFEISVLPFFPNFSPLLFSIIFFGITLYFSISKSKIIDIIGTYMTPFLLITLLTIILKGIFTPIANTAIAGSNQLSIGFLEGYHTMDSLSPMVIAGMIISNFKEKGIESKNALTRYTVYTELIAATGLILIYGGLTFLGAKISPIVSSGLGRTELLNVMVNYLLGSYGNIFLSIIVALACLTTAIGLTTATGDFFSKVSNNRLKYKHIVIVSILISAFLSIIGVEGIISFSVPILVTLYPVVIVLTFLNLLDDYIKNSLIYKTTVYFTLGVSLIIGIEAAGFKDLFIVKLFSKFPLWKIGFGWVSFSFLGLILGIVFSKFIIKPNKR
ncbi:branched-chain amino acid transport system II carrier protein [Tissierella creatinophila]|uniref:Branched-chain amino acid transport system carrier protein n=1 Tax=Tissierella creatinophila DSM 6911 TaxID=1123403 RepID=A0A1U7M2X2_TISCR|nr:branched-chain amino acid transport system II carrier protein [Tissierella creatinophila]OLS01641.1 branched-chain amino acid transport system 2 carrier protein [Tissierella creatinophila DSM 6911]